MHKTGLRDQVTAQLGPISKPKTVFQHSRFNSFDDRLFGCPEARPLGR
jgi:hypothetical protein